MISVEQIQALGEEIADEFSPERIVLFGSYAYGEPTADSDVDLLVILRFKGQGVRKAVEILNRVNPRFAVDLIVRTPEEIRQCLP